MHSLWAATRRTFLSLALCGALSAAVPAPKEHFGYTPGDDFKLAGVDEIYGYFKKLAASSDRGHSSEGRPMLAAFISSEENLKRLEHYKDVNRRLALGLATKDEADRLVGEAKAFVWIDSGLHATEVAPAQHAPHLAYRMITGEDDETRRIRQNVILVQVPVMNPDGLDMTVAWYRKNVGTAHETAALPWLYQKYSGHDNNRDWFMLNLPETRNVSRLLFGEWFPQIVYNQHQVAPFPARIFIPPYGEPLNPNIPAPVIEGINLIGSAMKERFARENKPGAISYLGFDAWWNGGLRSAPAFHNMHGILTETALYAYATPHDYKPTDLPERFSSGIPTKEPTVFYERPWLGGRWAIGDAVNYMLTADFAILSLAADNPGRFTRKAWQMAAENIEKGNAGGPYAYVVPAEQHDRWSAVEMLRRLRGAGLEVRRATAEFQVGDKLFPAGTYYLLAGQAFRGYLVDLMEPQRFPEIRSGNTVKKPYDLAGWTLPFQMGVSVERIEKPIAIAGEPVGALEPLSPRLDGREVGAFLTIARDLKQNSPVYRAADGSLGSKTPEKSGWQLTRPRVALYQPPMSNIDTGWTDWLLDTFEIEHSALVNADVRGGHLRARFDVIILAQQSMNSILHGTRLGERAGRGDWQTQGETRNQPRPEFTGGIGVEGATELQRFVEQGGTLIAFDSATELPLALFPIGVRGVASTGENAWFCPGSLLRILTDPKHPLAFGMPRDAIATSTGGQAFEITMLDEFNQGNREVKAFAWYARKDLLASGYISGERAVLGKPAAVDARLGQGHVVLIGFRPQFRGQSFGTFKFILNSIYQAAAKPL
jgi:hypothetical protein